MQRIRVRARQLGDRHFQINLTDRIALITQSLLRPGKGGRLARVKAAYFGFTTHDEAIAFANQIRGRFAKARIQLRKAERLNTAFEVRVFHDAVELLAWEIAKRVPTTSERIEQHIATHKKFIEARAQNDRFSAPVLKPTKRTMVTVSGRQIGID